MLHHLLANRLKRGVKERSRYASYFAAVAGKAANMESIAKHLRASYRKVNCPLIMISQVERSGGSLMAQLFDGHPELLAHPYELKFGYPDKREWPPTDLLDSDEQFRILFELKNVEFCETGYSKGQYDSDRKNFFIVPQVQREVFKEAMGSNRNTSRDVLNAYFTSYFNAWLNMRNKIEEGKFITGFIPMMAAKPRNMEAFWSTYPDGYLISIIRSPMSWHPSFVKLKGAKNPRYADVEVNAARWNKSLAAICRERERRESRVIILRFEDLVDKTEATMRLVCRRIGLEFHPSLLSPTFNWEPMVSNSIFGATRPGVVTTVPSRRESLLSDKERDYLEANCMPLYERALQEIAERV